MKKTIKRISSLFMASVCAVGLAGCTAETPTGGGETGGDKPTPTTYDNEKTPLTLATQTPDGVFNTFFSTSAYDGEIAGNTQLSMLGTDDQGGVKVGVDEPTVALDYSVVTTDNRADKTIDDDYENYYTTYKFLIKNDIKFSDGHDLTIDDVLFNMYVLLDPAYTGSTTMYSTNIQGLAAYRAQSLDEGEQNNVEAFFDQQASERIEDIVVWCDPDNTSAATPQVAADIERMKVLFKQELETDWNNAAASISSFEDTYKFTDAWQVFLYNYGLISIKAQKDDVWDKDTMGTECPEALNWNGWDTRGLTMEKDEIIDAVYQNMVNNPIEKTRKANIAAIVQYYATATTLKAELVAQAKSAYYEEARESGSLLIKNISGITTSEVTQFVGQSGQTANYAESHSVLQIVINGVDPKAIWNFSFSVCPMHYYSTSEEVAKVLAENANPSLNPIDKEHFGVPFGDADFMQQLKENVVPMGAGTYKVTNQYGSAGDVHASTDFYKDNIVYFERNEYFFKPATIKYLRYKVIASNQLYNAVKTGEVDYADPSATVQNNNNAETDDLGTCLVDNLGYGYIGINAKFVNELNVRRAIMYSMDTSLVLQYYTKAMASVIYRPMSSISWAYPDGCTSYYPYVGETYSNVQDQIDFICGLVEDAGYTKNRAGLYARTNPNTGKPETLTFTFSLAGESTDHPAYNTFAASATLLNKCGFKITVTNDPLALSKLSSGELAVWAAAWGSTIDPDMYQVYHKDSKAGSTKNWGYDYLDDFESEEEAEIRIALSDKIDEGRETVVQSERKEIYAEALDMVMDLAVELPTYQRKNLYVYNKNKIDASTLCQNITPYNGPLSRIW
jgi:peptide/nickel transport system substrate-binding protein